jgi:hypothetical protein
VPDRRPVGRRLHPARERRRRYSIPGVNRVPSPESRASGVGRRVAPTAALSTLETPTRERDRRRGRRGGDGEVRSRRRESGSATEGRPTVLGAGRPGARPRGPPPAPPAGGAPRSVAPSTSRSRPGLDDARGLQPREADVRHAGPEPFQLPVLERGVHRELRPRLPDHDALSAFGGTCRGKGIPLDVKSAYDPHPPTPESRLTAQQRRTLRVAHARGYRGPATEDAARIASYFGVSERAVSQRLRPGLNDLLADAECESRPLTRPAARGVLSLARALPSELPRRSPDSRRDGRVLGERLLGRGAVEVLHSCRRA